MFPSGSARTASWPVVLTGCVSSLVLALGMTPTFASFTASINNTINHAGTGTLVMQETNSGGGVTCLSTDGVGLGSNASSCSSINKYGDQTLFVGGSTVTLTSIKNVGSVDASIFAFTPGACIQSIADAVAGTAVDLCSKINVTITSGTIPIFNGTALALGNGGPIDVLSKLGIPKVTPGIDVPFSISATLDSSVNNAYQGLKISQSMTWTFST